MTAISGKYLGNLCSEFTHNQSGVKINVDGNGKGFSPIDLTAASLVACMMAMMAYTAESKGINLEGMSIEATMKRLISMFRHISSRIWLDSITESPLSSLILRL